MNISEGTFNKTQDIDKISIKRFITLYIAIVLSFLAIGPRIFSSDWVSSSDFHSCLEIIGSFIAIAAGVASVIFFFGLRNRFFLIVGLGFFIAGSEDLINGILSFGRIFADTKSDFSRFIPGTSAAGRITLATMLIAAPLVELLAKKSSNIKREALIYSSVALTVGGGFTAIASKIHLPQFIYPDRLISRPADFISAILFLISAPIMWRRYAAKRDIFSGMLLFSILFNFCGQIYVSFSTQLFDAFFDLANYAKIFSYIMPVLGISLQELEEMKTAYKGQAECKRVKLNLKGAYEQLERSNIELEEVQSQLIQNEKLASIGQLAAGVAHEMNTPVGFVAGNFQTLESHVKKILELLAMHDKLAGQAENSGDPQLKTVVEGIGQFREDMQIDFILEDIQRLFVDSKEGVGRTVEIIQNLRDFSRIDQPGSRDEYDLNEGIKSTLVMAKNEIKYDADVETDLSELPLIYCHCGQINQVLLNILVNAAQAIKSQEREDRGTITIRTYASDDAVVCEISDDGPGIPQDKISKIFDPFFTTKPPGKGTGLGLSLSYGIIVNKHNGELLVDSTVGEGTKFTIKLPVGTKENEEEKETISYGKENSVVCRR